MAEKPVTYADAGVDIDAGDALVERIKPLAKSTMRKEVLAGVGGFSALCAIPSKYKEPILVSSTDGVGTKLKLAFALDRHDTIGIDLVGMVVNDLVTCGAEPLFLLDYFAVGKLSVEQGEQVVKGVAEGCRQAGCALVGGETAEMPGFYPAGEYDVAGFGVGVVEKSKVLDGTKAKPGDALVAIASSGLHSNGYSLVRRLLGDTKEKLSVSFAGPSPQGEGGGPGAKPLETAPSLGETLLTPTRIYAKLVLDVIEKAEVHGIAHITGGGLPGNLPRVFPESLKAAIDSKTWTPPPIFSLLQEKGSVPRDEMFRTFNMGVGLVFLVPQKDVRTVIDTAKTHGDRAWQIGELERRASKDDTDCEIA